MLILALLACAPETDDAEVAPLLANDITTTARVLEDVAAQTNTYATCVPMETGCEACIDAEGTVQSGSFEASVTTPCTVAAGAGSWTVEASALTGGWTTDTEGVTLTLTGEQTSTWSGDRLTGTTVLSIEGATLWMDTDGTLDGFTLDAQLIGLTGRTYTLTLSEVDGVLTGEATGPVGRSCTVSGTLEQPDVDCS